MGAYSGSEPPSLSKQAWSLLAQRLQLSAREVQILRGLLNDKSESQIARGLKISNHTVHTHLKRLYRKLRVTSRCAAVSRIFHEYLTFEQTLGSKLNRD